MAEVYESNVINQEKPTKMLLEVANSKQNLYSIQMHCIKKGNNALENYEFDFGFNSFLLFLSLSLLSCASILGGAIRLYTEKLRTQPIITVLDDNPLPIQYISFASFESTENQFFYNCSHIDTSIQTKSIMG